MAQLHSLFVLLYLVSATDVDKIHAEIHADAQVQEVLEVFNPFDVDGKSSLADGMIITDMINIQHDMQMTVGTDLKADRELQLLQQLRSETQELINRHTRQLQEYDERIKDLEAQRNYVKIGVEGDGGSAEFISGGFEEGSEAKSWWLRDIADDEFLAVGAAPHISDSPPTEISINTTARTKDCTALKQDSHAIVELSAFCLDYGKRELLRFEHHEHPNVTGIAVTQGGGATLIGRVNEHLLGMCLHEQREILMPAQQAFGHSAFNDVSLPVPRNCTIMLRLQLLHFTELKDHEKDLANLDKAVQELQAQIKRASEMGLESKRKADKLKARAAQATREAESRLDEVVQLRQQEQRAREDEAEAMKRQKRFDDMANWGTLVVGIVVVIVRYVSDRRKRQQERSKKMKRTQRLLQK